MTRGGTSVRTMAPLDDLPMDEVYVALSALSIVCGAVAALVGHVGRTVTLGGGAGLRLTGGSLLAAGVGLIAAGTMYLAVRSYQRFRGTAGREGDG